MKKDLRAYKKVGVQFAYVLDCIYSDEVELRTDKERIEHFFRMYGIEWDCDYRRMIYPNEQDRIEQYVRGLPSCFRVAYANYAIIALGRSWGYALDTERKENEFVERWFSVIAFRLIQIRDRYMNY
jgi:hypothetical protein